MHIEYTWSDRIELKAGELKKNRVMRPLRVLMVVSHLCQTKAHYEYALGGIFRQVVLWHVQTCGRSALRHETQATKYQENSQVLLKTRYHIPSTTRIRHQN